MKENDTTSKWLHKYRKSTRAGILEEDVCFTIGFQQNWQSIPKYLLEMYVFVNWLESSTP